MMINVMIFNNLLKAEWILFYLFIYLIIFLSFILFLFIYFSIGGAQTLVENPCSNVIARALL